MSSSVVSVHVTRHSSLVRVSDAALVQAASLVIGSRYELSVVICGDARARALNRTYRSKDTPANVLSFPLGPHQGEIFLNAARIRREAKQYGHSPERHMLYLLIHGCLHLKGHTHGSTMERAEQKLLARCTLR